MAVRMVKAKADYYELDCNGNRLGAYVYAGYIISVEPNGVVSKFTYSKEFFDGCKAQRRIVALDVIHASGKGVVILPDGHVVPIP